LARAGLVGGNASEPADHPEPSGTDADRQCGIARDARIWRAWNFAALDRGNATGDIMGSLIKRTFSPRVTSLALRCIARQLLTLSHVAGATYHHSHKRGGKPPSALAKAAIPCSFWGGSTGSSPQKTRPSTSSFRHARTRSAKQIGTASHFCHPMTQSVDRHDVR